MSKIVRFTVHKVLKGDYKGKYYPTFYFEDSSIRAKRVFSLAGKEADTIDRATIYMMEHNEREEALENFVDGIANPEMQFKPIVELLDEFLLYQKNVKGSKETTIIDLKGVIDPIMKPFYGDKVLSQIDEKMMQDYLTHCNNQKNRKVNNGPTSKELSPRRKEKFWEVNKEFINWLMKRKYILSDPTKDIERPKSKPLAPPQYWKFEEFKQFISVIPEDSQDRALFLLAFLTGMRKGEILGLTWNDIDFKNDDIIIDKQFNSKIRKIDTPKTSDSVRKTKLPEIVKFELLKLRDSIKGHYGMTEERIKKLPVFTNKKFEHYPSKTLDNHMKDYVMASGVKKIKFHELRNSFITNSIDGGIPVDTIADMVGHRDVMTTLGVYKVTTTRHKENAKKCIDDFAASLFE